MPGPKMSGADFIEFLIATPKQATATEAQRAQPAGAADPAAHDAYTRLLYRLEPDAGVLREEDRPGVRLGSGMLVLDDSVLNNPYGRKMDLVHHWGAGKHHDVVKGIGLLTLLRTDGDRHLPCDYRLYDKVTDGQTKNDHFRELLDAAKGRGFSPACALFDWWYSGLENLEHVRTLGRRWLTRLKSNPPGEPRPVGVAARERVRHRRGGHRRPPGGLRSLPDRSQRRHRGPLGSVWRIGWRPIMGRTARRGPADWARDGPSQMPRHELTDAQWARVEPLLPANGRRGGQWDATTGRR